MKRSSYLIILLALVVGVVLYSFLYAHRSAGNNGAPGRRILYYVDPMNPSHTSDKPGLAPCGMKLEPVYADEAGGGAASGNGSNSMPPATVKVSAEKQQTIGVRISRVEKTSERHTIRTLGKVAVDENRTYRLLGWTDGWMLEIKDAATTGSLVQKDQLLASFYSREFLAAQQAYLFALNTMDRFTQSGKTSEEQMRLTNAQVQSAEENLKALGMGETQTKEIARTRQITKNIELRAPATGFIVARNIFPALRFDRGTEFFRIADMSRVWVLADIFENEAGYIHPGMVARIVHPQLGKTFEATASRILPQFDATSRTLKVRFELDNPDLVLRPDMFVDVEFPVSMPPAIVVPSDAVLDSGLSKTVFVDKGNGFFEPRKVETGWRFDNRVEITGGLMSGEHIVVSGNFLLDSESRMKMAASGIYGSFSKDPVCRMEVDEAKAKATGFISVHGEQTYYFCSAECKKEFDNNPDTVLASLQNGVPSGSIWEEGKRKMQESPASMSTSTQSSSSMEMAHPESYHEDTEQYPKPLKDEFNRTEMKPVPDKAETYKDPVCGMDVNKNEIAGKSTYLGKTYFFCSDECKLEFDRNPGRYMEKAAGGNPARQEMASPNTPMGENHDHGMASPATPTGENQGHDIASPDSPMEGESRP